MKCNSSLLKQQIQDNIVARQHESKTDSSEFLLGFDASFHLRYLYLDKGQTILVVFGATCG